MNKLFLAVIVASFTLIPLSEALAQPVAQFDTTRIDFGYSYPGKDLVHDFVITNKGNEPLQILDVRTSCGCTAAIPSSTTIPKGATSILSVTMTTSSASNMHKNATVRTNDPKNLSVRLDLIAKIHQVWKLSPKNSIHLGKVSFGETKSETIFMDNMDGSKYQIVGSKLIKPEFEHHIGEYVEGKGYPIKVNFQAPDKEGYITDTLIVRTNDPRQNIKVEEIRVEPELVDAQVIGNDDSGNVKLRFTFHAPEGPGLKRGSVFIKTNIEKMPEAELSYTAVVR